MFLWTSVLFELLTMPEMARRVIYNNMIDVDLTVMDRFLSPAAYGHWPLTT